MESGFFAEKNSRNCFANTFFYWEKYTSFDTFPTGAHRCCCWCWVTGAGLCAALEAYISLTHRLFIAHFLKIACFNCRQQERVISASSAIYLERCCWVRESGYVFFPASNQEQLPIYSGTPRLDPIEVVLTLQREVIDGVLSLFPFPFCLGPLETLYWRHP